MSGAVVRGVAAVMMLAAWPAAAQGDANAGLNAVYERIVEGSRTGDPAMSHAAYTADTTYLPPFASGIDGGERFHAQMKRMSDMIRADGVNMKLSFRLASREVKGDTAIDTGYYRTEMTRTKPTPASQTMYNKFLVVAARQADGSWKISHDASVPATKEAFEGATEKAGLKFDR